MNVQVGRVLVIIATICMFVFMSMIWMIAVKLDNYSIVDIVWGLTFILTTLVVLLYTGNVNIVSMTIAILVIIWGLRLSIYLFMRNAGKPEDYRYQDMRKKWGTKVKQTAFVRVFMLQGTVSLLFSLGIFLGISKSETILALWPVYVGAGIWLVGFLFESIGDAQLRAFIQKPENKGKVITSGLWKYTRHPNYFGESTQWFGISVIACAVPFGWISFISPLLLTFFLLKISGVPLLEKKNSQKPGYEEYAAKTSVFVPMPQKN